MTNRNRKPTMNQIAEKHDSLVEFVFRLSEGIQQVSDLVHILMNQLGFAKDSECSNCGMKVMWPTLDGFVAHPVCPNSQHDEQCAEGFSHIPLPPELGGEEE